ncbi:MAG: helix-turn-helix transcriptional regulator [bacterium]
MKSPPKRFTPRPDANWFELWRCGRKITKLEASRLLGISHNTVAAYEAGAEVPLYIALACSAISHGIPPMGSAGAGDRSD